MLPQAVAGHYDVLISGLPGAILPRVAESYPQAEKKIGLDIEARKMSNCAFIFASKSRA